MNYTIRAAAIATGVSESRLRTWERRYGIPQPGRSATGRRLYSEEDLEVIRRMAAFVAAGISASEAAAATKAGETAATAAPLEEQPAEHPLAVSITAASRAFDEAGTAAAIEEAVSALGWPGAIDQVLMPALRLIGDSWRDSELDLANEHFTSELIRRSLNGALLKQAAASGGPKVLLACPEDERHEFGILATCLLLRERELQTVYLGPDVPTPSLIAAIRQTAPDAVCLWATSEAGLAMLTRAVRDIANAKLPVRVFVGGRAVRTGDVSDVLGIVLAPTIEEAAAQVHNAVVG